MSNNEACIIEEIEASAFNRIGARPLYGVFLFEGTGQVNVDFIDYAYFGTMVLFTTPWQSIRFHTSNNTRISALWFHADYYCIEFHKKEVACNGLLFNNIYAQPLIRLNETSAGEIQVLLDRLRQELEFKDTYSQAVARTYLQLILALSSKAKIASQQIVEEKAVYHPVLKFKELLEKHFIKERRPSFYAEQLGMSVNTFSKKCKLQFHKSPSMLIQERVILEAKKLIHLSLKSMKEIAAELHFDDEHYFSRYFKKHTGIAPTGFRETVGIAQVAYSSI
ncbi:MAG: helix-turn-helix domain-containing protein [Bacteroidota bacterium]